MHFWSQEGAIAPKNFEIREELLGINFDIINNPDLRDYILLPILKNFENLTPETEGTTVFT